jgi:hypothetical protein
MKVFIILLIGVAIAGAQTMAPLDTVAFRIPTVTLRVAGEGVVDARSLTLARRELAKTLGQAGLGALWLTCTPGVADWRSADPCERDREPAEFWVRIVRHNPSAVRPDVLAFAEIDDDLGMRSAGVYYPAIVETAARHGIPAGIVMGAALAHEVGHLVLGAKAHSHHGLMSPDWRREQFERLSTTSLSFSEKDTRMLREELTFPARSRGGPSSGCLSLNENTLRR